MFLEEIAKTPFTKEFQFVCVDAAPGRSRPALPPYVKAVPTLMIQGETAPRTDGNVMNWLSERKMFSAGRSSVAATPASADGPSAFIGGDSFDDGLALIGEDMGNTNRLTGSMASLNDLSAMTAPDARTIPGSIMAASAGGGAGSGVQMSAKAKAMEDALERYRSARDVDVKGVTQRR